MAEAFGQLLTCSQLSSEAYTAALPRPPRAWSAFAAATWATRHVSIPGACGAGAGAGAGPRPPQLHCGKLAVLRQAAWWSFWDSSDQAA